MGGVRIAAGHERAHSNAEQDGAAAQRGRAKALSSGEEKGRGPCGTTPRF